MPIDPKIAIVILNYNGLADTIECLESVYKINYSNFVVILVDNGSKIDPTHEIRKRFKKDILIIKNNENLGFAEGSNVGIRKGVEIGAELIFLLNNDTVAHPNILTSFVAATKKYVNAGIFGAKILRYDNKEIIDHFGGYWNKNKAEFLSYGNKENFKSAKWAKDIPCDYVCGCAFLIKKQVVEKTGFLDPKFFLLWEEADYCFRAKENGFEIMAIADAILWHKISQSFSGGEIHSEYFWWRNRLHFIKKNLSKMQKIKIYVNVIVPEIIKLYKHNFLKSMQLQILSLLKSNKINKQKVNKIIKYKARIKGIKDYFFKNHYNGPSWLFDPKKHKLFIKHLKNINN